ncbi:MAG: excinuclease ABC subunit C [Flavobacteriales bacterium CG_4_9_14_3_um_filter_40_17]|nr:MAG: excinuclease ABC subunit C [Flavobacteriales bacterium CG_4_9_14_3_um_filter_40_17]
MPETELSIQLQTLPELPGVYQYFDKAGKILYVGKAKNLRKRVSSYFNKDLQSGKTRVLVKKIASIRHIVVGSETDALLLENNLIKEHQPRYNVLLKDDKTYPWICIKKEAFPRIFATRRMTQDGSEYFGPYTNFKTIHTLLDLIKSLYPLRTCTFDLSQKNIENEKFKVCLEYHLGNCKGACEGKESPEAYQTKVDAVREILKGNFKTSISNFKREMYAFATEMAFEKAQYIKEKIVVLENYQAKSTVVNPSIHDVDVFSILSDETAAYVNYVQIAHGSIVRSHTLELKKKLDEPQEELFQLGIIELRQRFDSKNREIYLPFPVDLGENVNIHIPKIGDKKRILELSHRNAVYFRLDKLKQIKITDPERHEKRLMAQMKKDLRMSAEPVHIECFDNSNIQGTNPVAACVVFRNGKPSKKDYRHFNIKTVEGPDDFASMEEVVFRRYKRMLEENQPLPQLIVIDGGKGQLSAALKSLEKLELRGKISIIGIAKRLEEIYFPNDSIPLYLDKKSETLKIIQQLRNEAHRFGISFHRNKRSSASLHSSLEQIKGIGEQSQLQLLNSFKSVKRISTATKEDLTKILGASKAKLVYEYFLQNPIN